MKTTTQRDATRIVELATKGAADPDSYHDREKLFNEIASIAKAIDASTGRRDSSTKSRRSKSATRGVRKSAKRKRAKA